MPCLQIFSQNISIERKYINFIFHWLCNVELVKLHICYIWVYLLCVGAYIGPTLGMIASGMLDHHLGWQYVFFAHGNYNRYYAIVLLNYSYLIHYFRHMYYSGAVATECYRRLDFPIGARSRVLLGATAHSRCNHTKIVFWAWSCMRYSCPLNPIVHQPSHNTNRAAVAWRMSCGWLVLWASFQLYPPKIIKVNKSKINLNRLNSAT